MNRLLFLLHALLYSIVALSQSIVPNHDFSLYSSCPNNYSEIVRCTGWYQPSQGTSDYFNACAIGTNVGLPANLFGYQESSSNAYAGLLTYIDRGADYREYIGASFNALVVGNTYEITINVSLADSSRYATDGLGIYFSTSRVNSHSSGPLSVKPQIDYSIFGAIKDKENWVTLSRSFIADSPYTNLAIGCFTPDNKLSLQKLDEGSNLNVNYAYYYIGPLIVKETFAPYTGLDTSRQAFPNAFTPNNDGKNDVFKMIYNNATQYSTYSLHIFNRWGQEVFRTEDINAGWDGSFNGYLCDIGAYFYMAEFTVNGNTKLLKGDLTLAR